MSQTIRRMHDAFMSKGDKQRVQTGITERQAALPFEARKRKSNSEEVLLIQEVEGLMLRGVEIDEAAILRDLRGSMQDQIFDAEQTL